MTERYENMDDDLDTISQEGWDARLQFMDFSDNPYTRDTVEWEAWRLGWSRGDYTIWYGILMEKRRSQADE